MYILIDVRKWKKTKGKEGNYKNLEGNLPNKGTVSGMELKMHIIWLKLKGKMIKDK